MMRRSQESPEAALRRQTARLAMGAFGAAAMLLVWLALAIGSILAAGCMSAAVSVILTDSNSLMGFVRVQGDAIAPGLGSESGPRLSVSVAKDAPAGTRARLIGAAVLSNRTDFAGCYSAAENKQITFDLELAAGEPPPPPAAAQPKETPQ